MSSPPTVSNHLATLRWPARGNPSEPPRAAWERAEELDVSNAPHGHARVPDHDEARFDAETQTVLFRRESMLTTCYSVGSDAEAHPTSRAAREAVEAQYGPIEDSDMRFTEADS